MTTLPLVDVAAVASRLLDLVIGTAAEADVPLPPRRYVTAGLAGTEAWDDEQLTVGLVSLAPDLATRGADLLGGSPAPGGALGLPAVVLRVELLRAMPQPQGGVDGQIVTEPSEEHAAGVAALIDAALLHAVRVKVMQGAALTDGEPADVRLSAVTPVGPEGGLAGMAMTVTTTLV